MTSYCFNNDIYIAILNLSYSLFLFFCSSNYLRVSNIIMNFDDSELSGTCKVKVVDMKEPKRLGDGRGEIVQRGKKKTTARLSRRRDCVLMYGWHSDDNRDKLLY